jgi:hypothetical protein
MEALMEIATWRQRMDDTAFRSECRHWWARPWNMLSKSDRRRLRTRPGMFARWQAWDTEADMRWDDNVRLVYGHVDATARIGMRVTTDDLVPPGAINKATRDFWQQRQSGEPDAATIRTAMAALWEKCGMLAKW